MKEIEDEVNAIREEYNEDKKCLIGWCPNIYSDDSGQMCRRYYQGNNRSKRKTVEIPWKSVV